MLPRTTARHDMTTRWPEEEEREGRPETTFWDHFLRPLPVTTSREGRPETSSLDHFQRRKAWDHFLLSSSSRPASAATEINSPKCNNCCFWLSPEAELVWDFDRWLLFRAGIYFSSMVVAVSGSDWFVYVIVRCSFLFFFIITLF